MSSNRPVAVLIVALLAAGCTVDATPETTSTRPLTTSTDAPSTTMATTTSTVTTTSTTSLPVTTTTTSPPTSTTATTTTTTIPAPGPATVVTRVSTSQPVVALTFDAGSDRGYAEEILDTLAAHDIEASFGMTGRWAEANPDLLARMAAEGHTLINHTYDHPHMETLGTAARLDQLARAETIIEGIVGVSTKPWFRPPYGSYNRQVLVDVGAAGYRYSVMWTVDTLGWKGLPPSEVVARCRAGLGPGAIVLMHVGAASTDNAALEDVIAAIEEGGYRFATIEELLP